MGPLFSKQVWGPQGSIPCFPSLLSGPAYISMSMSLQPSAETKLYNMWDVLLCQSYFIGVDLQLASPYINLGGLPSLFT